MDSKAKQKKKTYFAPRIKKKKNSNQGKYIAWGQGKKEHKS